MKRLFVVLCFVSLLAPVVYRLDATRWRPGQYRGYEDHFAVGIPAFAIASLGGVSLIALGIAWVIKRARH